MKHINVENTMKTYKQNQLNKLKIDDKGIYLPTLQIIFGENKTNWLSITFKQYEQIKQILTNESGIEIELPEDLIDTIEQAIIILEDNENAVDDGNQFKAGHVALELFNHITEG